MSTRRASPIPSGMGRLPSRAIPPSGRFPSGPSAGMSLGSTSSPDPPRRRSTSGSTPTPTAKCNGARHPRRPTFCASARMRAIRHPANLTLTGVRRTRPTSSRPDPSSSLMMSSRMRRSSRRRSTTASCALSTCHRARRATCSKAARCSSRTSSTTTSMSTMPTTDSSRRSRSIRLPSAAASGPTGRSQ